MPLDQDLLREYAGINRRRKSEGITPLEYQRWLDLAMQLEAAFPDRPVPGSGGSTCIAIEFATEESLTSAIMLEIKPVGLFVATPFAPEPGTRLKLRVHVKETRERFSSPIVVASNNIGPGYSTQALGMGLRFTARRCDLRQKLESLCGIEEEAAPEKPDPPASRQ